jgi:Arc/MetJ-type ribon-helix-helix transcriptional regulator
MAKIETVNVRIPRKVVDWLDDLIKEGLYKSRSEAIRAFLREYVLSEEKDAKSSSLAEGGNE